MAKLIVNPERMEEATWILNRTKNTAEELLYCAKKLRSETAEDLELQQALEYPQIAENLDAAWHTLTHTFALLEELAYRFGTVVSRFEELETENKTRIAALAAMQKNIADSVGNTTAAALCAGADLGDAANGSKDVERLVRGAYENLEVANLAAYLKILEEDYCVETVQVTDLQQEE